MLCVVAPVDQAKEEPADAVKVTLPPWQKVVEPSAEMLAAAGGLSISDIPTVN
jgi:hypothetical protein